MNDSEECRGKFTNIKRFRSNELPPQNNTNSRILHHPQLALFQNSFIYDSFNKISRKVSHHFDTNNTYVPVTVKQFQSIKHYPFARVHYN